MLSQTTHELILEQTKYVWWLEESKKKAYNDFIQYTFDLDAQREELEKIKREAGGQPSL